MKRAGISDGLHDLSFEFFYWFSRFEFALKECGYLKSKKVGAKAEASWDRFIDNHAEAYVLSNSGSALIEAAPQRQIVGAADLEFAPVTFAAADCDLKKVVTLSNTVRNNLFHGGKHGHATWDDPERVRLLLSLVIQILDELAEHAGFEADYRRSY
ncbi:hypothetical protein PRN20_09505 [Devosia sp. ZB163]|uniref:hypothetical protein n=1 Tax=Devosia sp. ZB163 TaxID=3025938 RepID=UPI00235FD2B2|nr:hypothetical protein [Devosia sp. ZB163]MDC9823971.1 hypothetical protein [Devosia sp. ZB163]